MQLMVAGQPESVVALRQRVAMASDLRWIDGAIEGFRINLVVAADQFFDWVSAVELRRAGPSTVPFTDRGTDDRTGRGIRRDNLRGKDSCDAGRKSGRRNGVCWKNATSGAADVHRAGQIWVQDAEAGADVASRAARRVCLVFTRLL